VSLATLTGTLLLAALPRIAAADVVTGTVTPAGAKVVITNAAGAQVAELKGGAYQLQLPVGKYKAQCQAPKNKSQDVLVLSEPVTVNIDCS
jgi:phosphate-selective porin